MKTRDIERISQMPVEQRYAAAKYLDSREHYWNEFSATVGPDHCPVFTPAVQEAKDVMDDNAAHYCHNYDGYICEDCGELERCVCPSDNDDY